MGLLDGILGNVLGGVLGGGQRGGGPLDSILGRLGGGQSGPDSGSGSGMGGMAGAAIMALALQLIQRNGGLTGVLDKLRGAGLGQQANSWVGTGANMPVGADQLRAALGGSEIGELASHFGLSPEQATDGLSQLMPELVNQMTPEGEVTGDHNDVIAQALEQLRPVAGR